MEMSARLRRQGMAGEAFLREQLEAASKEIKQLKTKMDQLEKENASLKKSVYDLSLRYAFDAGAAIRLTRASRRGQGQGGVKRHRLLRFGCGDGCAKCRLA